MNTGLASESQSHAEGATAETSGSTGESASEHHSVYCPTCSTRLSSRRGKLLRANCGYYLSCADYL